MPKGLIFFPELFGVDDAGETLCGGGEIRDFLFGIDIDAADEDGVDAFETFDAAGTFLSAAPDVVAGDFILTFGKDERDVEDDASTSERFEGIKASGSCRDLDHAVLVAGRPFLAELNVASNGFIVRGGCGDIFEKGVEFEADIPVVAFGLFPDGKKNVLGLLDEFVGDEPRDFIIILSLVEEGDDVVVEAAGGNEAANDDGIGGGAGGSEREVDRDKIWIDGIEPDLRAGCDKGLKTHVLLRFYAFARVHHILGRKRCDVLGPGEKAVIPNRWWGSHSRDKGTAIRRAGSGRRGRR